MRGGNSRAGYSFGERFGDTFDITAWARPIGEPNCARMNHIAPVMSSPATPLAAAALRVSESARLRSGALRRKPPPAAKPSASATAIVTGEARPSSALRPACLPFRRRPVLTPAMRVSTCRISASISRCIAQPAGGGPPRRIPVRAPREQDSVAAPHEDAEEVARRGRDAERGDRVLAHVLARAFDPVLLHLHELVGLLAEAVVHGRRGLGGAVDGAVRAVAQPVDGLRASCGLRFHWISVKG